MQLLDQESKSFQVTNLLCVECCYACAWQWWGKTDAKKQLFTSFSHCLKQKEWLTL